MSAGLQVIGDHGSVQIDQNYYNMVLITNGYVGSGLYNITPPDAYGDPQTTAYMAVINYNGTNPILCLDTKGYCCAHYQTVYNGANSYTFYVLTFDGNGNPTPATIAYYIYDTVPNIQATSRGLTVWNASGQVTFNSDYEPMRLINFAQCPAGFTITTDSFVHHFPPASTTLWSGSAAQKIAVCMTPPKGYYMTIHMGSNDQWVQTFLTNNGANPPYVTTEGGGENGAGSATPYGYMGDLSYYVSAGNYAGMIYMVDVTNHYI
jgi:hypothetical protein